MRVYIVWVKGKKVTLKHLLGRMFRKYFMGRPYPRDTHEILQADMTLQLPPCALFAGALLASFSRTSREIVLILYFMLDSSPT